MILYYYRVKRGRGSVGPRVDETFPCPPVTELSRTLDTGDGKLVLQPERSPLSRHETDSSEEEEEVHDRAHRKRKEHKQKLSKKHKSKEKKRDGKKKRREEKRRKHSRD